MFNYSHVSSRLKLFDCGTAPLYPDSLSVTGKRWGVACLQWIHENTGPPLSPWRLALDTGPRLMHRLPCSTAVAHSTCLTLPCHSHPRASQLQLLLSSLQEAEKKSINNGNYGRQNSSDCRKCEHGGTAFTVLYYIIWQKETCKCSF